MPNKKRSHNPSGRSPHFVKAFARVVGRADVNLVGFCRIP